MNGTLVSVIVPVFNAAPFLDELCQSIQAQTHNNFEALFLDDGSTDGSKAVLERYRMDSRFKIFSWEPNRGVTAATTELLRRMQGDYWCHPGADDVLHPSFIEERLSAARQFPTAAIIHGPGENIDERGNPLSPTVVPDAMPQLLEGSRAVGIILEHNIINTPAVLVNASVTKEILNRFVGGWRYAQDWFLWILHLATGNPLVWQSKPLHKYRMHPQSLTMNPRHAATRLAEIRLVPLCALAAARDLSDAAAQSWSRWRLPLYSLWLRRALKLRRLQQLDPAWLTAGTSAFHGNSDSHRSLNRECSRCLLNMVAAGWREASSRRENRFFVSGLAQVGDPLFH